MLFRIADEICGKPTSQLPPVKSKDGRTLENMEEIQVRWKEHFEELYNIQNLVDQNILKELQSMNAGEEIETL